MPDRIGSRDITALVAERVVRETLTGVALQRAIARGRPSRQASISARSGAPQNSYA